MRVALGTTVLEQGLAHGGVDGIGNYSRELMAHLKQIDQFDIQPYVFSGIDPSQVDGPVFQAGRFGIQALYALATGRALPDRFSPLAGPFDLVHATDHLIPNLPGVPVLATIMDAIPLSHPEWVSYSLKKLKNAMWKRSAHWASHVITISDYSKQELIRWFGIPDQRISVTHLGVDQRWFDTPPEEELARVRKQFCLPERFFLFIGTLQPRKNLARLIEAHKMLAPTLRRDCPLVVVGRAGWGCEAEVQALEDGEQDSLCWLDYVPDPDLLALVSQASVLTFPSLHEGFGLPVLEAFAAGVPVVCSNTTSLPEVAGDAALLVDPLNAGDLADAMRQLVTDEALAENLRLKGRERAAKFTWNRTAGLTADIYRQLIESY